LLDDVVPAVGVGAAAAAGLVERLAVVHVGFGLVAAEPVVGAAEPVAVGP